MLIHGPAAWRHTAASPAAYNLAAALRASIQLTEMQHLGAQLRFFAALLAGYMVCELLDPALLLLTGTDSLLYRVAEAMPPGAQAAGRVFTVLAVLMLPYLLLQFGACARWQRGITQLACLSLALVGLAWTFLAWQSVHLQLPVVPWVFARNAGGALLFALALAMSLNREQIRNLMEHPR